MKVRDLWQKEHTWEVASIWGTLIFLGLTFYFLLMYAVGLIHVIELRFLNIFIMLAGIYYAMMQYRRVHGGHISYFRALTLGAATGFIGTTTFGIFLFFFLKLEGSLMASIQASEQIGRYLNPYIASAVVMCEGVFSGFGLSYLLVNYISTDDATTPHGGSIPVADHHGNYSTDIPQS